MEKLSSPKMIVNFLGELPQEVEILFPQFLGDLESEYFSQYPPDGVDSITGASIFHEEIEIDFPPPIEPVDNLGGGWLESR